MWSCATNLTSYWPVRLPCLYHFKLPVSMIPSTGAPHEADCSRRSDWALDRVICPRSEAWPIILAAHHAMIISALACRRMLRSLVERRPITAQRRVRIERLPWTFVKSFLWGGSCSSMVRHVSKSLMETSLSRRVSLSLATATSWMQNRRSR
ncbi:uncharacterized protein BO95DRAFT_139968 [Aspergillus brunneoviolaceus CBS 621.78]|uniref:Uncharacterized protein n=1 Tax=Aspergillus brunneoviolaceus CBS 621.78 TaxID=1450534 RepID=A0ACD1G7Z6_9EURO|nr:hypothetical protein BO95DRAFT_139968 [Aspergillus brunneoviolaceus CBS 621.78]RAH45404.1 hypothetical protein BO95DRAFT_139968 [Aspergillus brunneoviolaceus CBS 621.78]